MDFTPVLRGLRDVKVAATSAASALRRAEPESWASGAVGGRATPQDTVFEVLNAIRDQRTDVGEMKDTLAAALRSGNHGNRSTAMARHETTADRIRPQQTQNVPNAFYVQVRQLEEVALSQRNLQEALHSESKEAHENTVACCVDSGFSMSQTSPPNRPPPPLRASGSLPGGSYLQSAGGCAVCQHQHQSLGGFGGLRIAEAPSGLHRTAVFWVHNLDAMRPALAWTPYHP